jgi:hypothetical protein
MHRPGNCGPNHGSDGKLLLTEVRPEPMPEREQYLHREAELRVGDARFLEADAVRTHLHSGGKRGVPGGRVVPIDSR